MEVPLWALTPIYWLHMLATVVWIGGLAALSFLILPAARAALQADAYAAFLVQLQRRLDILGWLSLAVLAATGMLQMGANPNYQGFLTIDNHWATAILIKHLVFLGMIGVAGYLSWGLMPRLRRLAMRQALMQKDSVRASDEAAASHMPAASLPNEISTLQRQETALLRLNLLLGVIVLALTALARAAA